MAKIKATGRSAGFSFEEAFLDAVSNLDLGPPTGADQILGVTVESIAAQFGGIDGRQLMLVTVETETAGR